MRLVLFTYLKHLFEALQDFNLNFPLCTNLEFKDFQAVEEKDVMKNAQTVTSFFLV